MKVTVRREDRMLGYASTLVDVKIQVFDEDGDFEEEFIKQVADKGVAEFDFELSDDYKYAVKCHIDGCDIREWFGLRRGSGNTDLRFGLKKVHLDIVEDYIAEQRESIAEESKSSVAHRFEMDMPISSRVVDKVIKNNHAVPGQDEIDHSRFIDQAKLTKGYTYAAAGVTLMVIGAIFVVESIRSGWFDIDALWKFLMPMSPGLIVGIMGVAFVNSSGVYDSRCKKCNSNRLEYSESDGKYLGTYSQQEQIANRNTQQVEFVRVIKTDFEYVGTNTCLSCGYKESFSFRRSTNSD